MRSGIWKEASERVIISESRRDNKVMGERNRYGMEKENKE